MEKDKTVEKYFAKHENWRKELEKIREIFLKTELSESIKWGIPTYSAHGKNIVAIASFKHHIALWFYNGVFLKDEKKVLVNANEEKTRGLRQWRIASVEDIDPDVILSYVLEAIQNQKEGKEIKPETKKLVIPTELQEALNSNEDLKSAFQTLTPGKQKEYAEYIDSAKRETTRAERMNKCAPIILSGKGLNDKYRK